MRVRFRKFGLVLSALALLVTAVCLPLHHHAEETGPSQTHCDVCHFASKAKPVTPTLPYFDPSVRDVGIAVVSSFESPRLISRPATAPSRAPPASC